MITDALAELLRIATLRARDAGDITLSEEPATIQLETPRNKQHGDYSSNLALTLKKATGMNDSRALAACILQHLPADPLVDRVEIAGPGFLNFYLKPDWLHNVLKEIETADASYGFQSARTGERVLIEFVSANPTGPISVVNGRAAALGDVLANLLAAQGCAVDREYYINDALNSLQLEKFANSVRVRYLQFLGHPVLVPASGDSEVDVLEAGIPATLPDKPTIPFPKDGYRGEYVKDIAQTIFAAKGASLAEAAPEESDAYFRKTTLERMIETQRGALEAFGVRYDTWFFESSIYAEGQVEATIQNLKDRDYAYEQDGALWLKSTEFGDDKDRVLVRSNEKATYIAADIAYHRSKFSRGYTHLINIWGADHHGYVARLKAGIAAVGYNPNDLEIILTQMISLVRDGEAVIGGKRKGAVIELKEDLTDEIGKDAARFYFLLNSYETPATVDVELAKRQSNENPVFYVQYAHARLANIRRKAAEQGYALSPASEVDLSVLTEPSELDVLRKLADYPSEVALAAQEYAPHRLTRFGMDLASLLNGFYENCRVLPGWDDSLPREVTAARLALANGARIVLRNLFAILGVSAPEQM